MNKEINSFLNQLSDLITESFTSQDLPILLKYFENTWIIDIITSEFE